MLRGELDAMRGELDARCCRSRYSMPMTDLMTQRVLAQANSDEEGTSGSLGSLVEEAPPKLKKPPMYKVVLLNDDYTPMEFVRSSGVPVLPRESPRGRTAQRRCAR